MFWKFKLLWNDEFNHSIITLKIIKENNRFQTFNTLLSDRRYRLKFSKKNNKKSSQQLQASKHKHMTQLHVCIQFGREREPASNNGETITTLYPKIAFRTSYPSLLLCSFHK